MLEGGLFPLRRHVPLKGNGHFGAIRPAWSLHTAAAAARQRLGGLGTQCNHCGSPGAGGTPWKMHHSGVPDENLTSLLGDIGGSCGLLAGYGRGGSTNRLLGAIAGGGRGAGMPQGCEIPLRTRAVLLEDDRALSEALNQALHRCVQ